MKLERQQIRAKGHFPSELLLKPEDVVDLQIENLLGRTLALLYGQTLGESFLVRCEPEGALRVAAYGSGYTDYHVISGTAPASFGDSDELLSPDGGRINRWDFLIEDEEVEIRFRHWSALVWGEAIPLPKGAHSIEIAAAGVQIRQRGASAGAYTIVGWR